MFDFIKMVIDLLFNNYLWAIVFLFGKSQRFACKHTAFFISVLRIIIFSVLLSDVCNLLFLMKTDGYSNQ